MYDRCVHMHSMSAYALACARTLPAFAVCACERACNKFGSLLGHCLVVIVPASLAIILIEPRNPHVTFHY